MNDAAALAAAVRTLSDAQLRELLRAAADELSERENKTARATEPQHPDVEKVKAASRDMLAARKRGPRGPRVKPDPRLPHEAPEIYRHRKPRKELGGRKEKLLPFLRRVYGPLLDIMTHADLTRLDPTAAKAIYNTKDGQHLPPGLIPVEFELNTQKRVAARGQRRSKDRALSAEP
jgi:hypothetical protein